MKQLFFKSLCVCALCDCINSLMFLFTVLFYLKYHSLNHISNINSSYGVMIGRLMENRGAGCQMNGEEKANWFVIIDLKTLSSLTLINTAQRADMLLHQKQL